PGPDAGQGAPLWLPRGPCQGPPSAPRSAIAEGALCARRLEASRGRRAALVGPPRGAAESSAEVPARPSGCGLQAPPCAYRALRSRRAMSAAAQGDYVAGVLRDMYGGGALPRAATQLLRDRCKARSSSAPPARTWSNSASEGRAERRRGRKPRRPAGAPRGARPGLRGAGAAAQDASGAAAARRDRPGDGELLPPRRAAPQLGRDNDAERQWLADRRYIRERPGESGEDLGGACLRGVICPP
ncbi:unnamed protein product, partial [Prorocentrum cordatum]